MTPTLASKYQNQSGIDWYRTPVDPGLLQSLNDRSDARGFAQAGVYLALIIATGAAAVYTQQHLPWMLLIPALLLHGTVCAFMSNAAHELVHGTVFKTTWLNRVFLLTFGFLRWFPYDYYWASHTEHHKFTLHPSRDQEVVLPTHFTLADFLKTGFFDPARLIEMLKSNLSFARGRLAEDWGNYVLGQDPARFAAFRWSRILLAGHSVIAVVSVYHGHWIIPVVVSLSPCYGGWLFYLCNNSQHAGLQDDVADFRLNCRTMTLHPFLEFLYWHMNFHTEHHMYAAVPCYNLRRLHDAIKHDLPPTANGLAETWQQIITIQQRQATGPGYQYDPPLPGAILPRTPAAESGTVAATPRKSDVSRPGSDDRPYRRWECSVCGFVYAERSGLPEEGIPPGTAWEDIPADWKCPDCGTSKADFQMVEIPGL